jgi:C-terminal processing protease CtpA/Prc
VILAANSPAHAEKQLSRDQMEQDIQRLVDAIRQNYSYIDEKKQQHGFDVDELQSWALSKLDGINTSDAFRELLKEAVARLRDGHCATNVGPTLGMAWPVVLQSVKEGVLITGVHEEELGQGVARGDLLRKVDKTPIDDLLREAERTIPASTDLARRRLALRSVVLTKEKEVTLHVEHPNGTSSVVTLKTHPPLPVTAVPNLGDLPVGQYLAYCGLDHNTGYIRVTSMSWGVKKTGNPVEDNRKFQPARDAIDAAFVKVAKTDALVLDLRGNSGGYDNVGAHIAAHLLPYKFLYISHRKRECGLFGDWLYFKPQIEPHATYFAGDPYTRPLAVLIDEGSFSATATLAAALRDLRPHVFFVGRPMHAGVGGPESVRLPNSGVVVSLCREQVRGPGGKLIEGDAPAPHVPVEWTRDDVLTCRDADLDAALEALRR